MKAELYFKNQQRNKQGIYNIIRETKNFLWLENEYSKPLKVSKKSYRVWVIFPDYITETAKANYLSY